MIIMTIDYASVDAGLMLFPEQPFVHSFNFLEITSGIPRMMIPWGVYRMTASSYPVSPSIHR